MTAIAAPAARRSALPALSRSIGSVLAGAVLLLVLAWAIVPDLFATHSAYDGIPSEQFLPPSAAHIFGTDQLGRDVFSRVVHGTRTALLSSLVAVLIGLIAGSVIGLLAGFFGRAVDAVLGRIIDVLLAIPNFLLAVIVIVSLGFDSLNAALAVGASSIAVFARLIRSETLRVKTLPYVEAAVLGGGNRLQVLFEHVLPNTYRSVFALAVLQFGIAILTISGLAFLGYGNPPPAADWGLQVAEGKDFLYLYPWLVYAPGILIVLTVVSINQLSKSIRKEN